MYTEVIQTLNVEEQRETSEITLRGFHGEEDFPLMAEIINTAKVVDDVERTTTVEEIKINYEHLVRSDPYKDMLFAEVNGEVVAYGRCWWDEELNGDRLYTFFVFQKPAWRGQGIGKAMADRLMLRLREIAAEHPASAPKYYQVWASDSETWYKGLITSLGFDAVRYGLSMTRPCADLVNPASLPERLEIRPVKPEHYRKIWDAQSEAFRDHWGYVEPTEKDYKAWQEWPTFQPEIWKVAWDGDEVVGMVLNFINHEENKEYDRKRGYTENISVRRPWRKQGVARALLTVSIEMFQEMGMEETALGVDTENPNGAKRLYESVGYREIKRFNTYRMKMDD